MNDDRKEWTHTNVRITDIRKLSEFYIFTIGKGENPLNLSYGEAKGEDISAPLMVKDKIFEERLKPYFLKDAFRVSREEILEVRWNMHITKGHYIKISRGDVQEYSMDPDKYYVSYLEIAGPLGTFQSICKDKELR